MNTQEQTGINFETQLKYLKDNRGFEFTGYKRACPVAQITIDNQGVLALTNERARAQFGLTAHDIGRPFQDLQLSFRPTELRAAIEKCFKEKAQVSISNVVWLSPSGEKIYLHILLSPLLNNGNGVVAVLISFINISIQVHLQEKLELNNMQLETTPGDLQPAIHAVQAGKSDHRKLTLQATTRRGKPMHCEVTVLPLILNNHRLQGSILLVDDHQG